MEIKYSKICIVTALELPITEDSYWKYPVYIYKDGLCSASLNLRYLSMSEVEDLLSGDEEAARLVISNYAETLKSIASNIQYLINK